MDFNSSDLLAKSASRAKSDVANKLVSMVLHQLTQNIESNISIRSENYRKAVQDVFQTIRADIPFAQEESTAPERQ